MTVSASRNGAPTIRISLYLFALLLGFSATSLASPHSLLPFPVRDDYWPSLAIDSTNAPWVVWVSSFADTSAAGSGDAVYAARWTDSTWDTTCVTPEQGRYLDPQIAADSAGVLVAWVRLDGPNSDVIARRFTDTWSDPFPVADDLGADFAPALSADSAGQEWIAWQKWTGSSYDICLARVVGDSVAERLVVANSAANDREPDVAPAPGGGVWVAWSSIRSRHDEICLRRWDGRSFQGPMRAVTSQRSWSRYPSIAVDAAGKIWIAYYHLNRTWTWFEDTWPEPSDLGSIRIICLDPEEQETGLPFGTGNSGQVPRPSMEDVGYYVPEDVQRIYGYRPHLLLDASQRVWVFSKMNGYYLESGVQNLYWGLFGVCYDHDDWSDVPQVFSDRNAHFWDMPAVALDRTGKLWAAWTKDRRDIQPVHGPVNILGPDADIRVDTFIVAEGTGMPPDLTQQHTIPSWNGGSARSVPRYTVETGSGSYNIYWGENHRHSCDFSYDAIWDLTFEETIATTFERVGYDWIAPGEHVEWWTPLVWNMISKWVDLYDIPGQFTTFAGYEKSGRNPGAGVHGDQNVLYRSLADWSSRDAPSGPLSSWLRYYRAFTGKDVLCIPHHTANAEAFGYTIWEELVPNGADSAETPVRLVEMFQTNRGSFEYPGCPWETWDDQVGPDTGWVNLALEEGLRVGFVAGGDHTLGNGFTAVLAEDGSRDAIFGALRARRCYGTSFSKKIYLDFRVNGELMGSEIVTDEAPLISYKIIGTSGLTRVVIVKNGDPEWYVSVQHFTQGDSASFADPDSVIPGTSASYYLRAQQWDGGIAWSSPIWVDFLSEVGVADNDGCAPGGVGLSKWRVFPAPFVPGRGPLEIVPPANGRAPETIRVYSLDGRLVNELDAAGGQVVPWDGKDRSGREVATGVYFLGLDGGPGGKATRKVILVR